MADRALSQDEIIRKNIAALTEMQQRDEERRTRTDRWADAVTRFSGSMAFVYLHVVWFGLWIALNIGLVRGGSAVNVITPSSMSAPSSPNATKKSARA